MKKKLSLILIMVLVAAAFVCFQLPATADTENGWTYTVESGKATVTKCPTSASGAVTVPDTLGGCPVTALGYRAFYAKSSVTSVTLPSTLTDIGEAAFQSCSALTTVNFPANLKTIGNTAFRGCSLLDNVTLPNKVTAIGDYAFYGCSGLTNITFPTGLKTIGVQAFRACTKLTNVVLPSGMTSISLGAFRGCSKLASITVPFIGEAATGSNRFFGYIFGAETAADNPNYVPTSLKTVTALNGAGMPGNIFDGCKYITTVDLSSMKMTQIGQYAFRGCSALKTVVFPSTVTTLRFGAFYGCTSLEEMTLPAGVTKFMGSAFYACTKLADVTVSPNMTDMGEYAFYKTAITEFTVPSAITEIKRGAFSQCSKLTTVTLPDGVTTFGLCAFQKCKALRNVAVRSDATFLKSAFEGATIVLDGVVYSMRGTSASLMSLADETITDLVIPTTLQDAGAAYPYPVTEIAQYAFKDNKTLTLVNIGGVPTIGWGAFQGCSNVTSLTLGKGIKTINGCAFQDCAGLTELSFPSTLKKIGNQAFYNCSLTSIPDTTGISTGNNVFGTKATTPSTEPTEPSTEPTESTTSQAGTIVTGTNPSGFTPGV